MPKEELNRRYEFLRIGGNTMDINEHLTSIWKELHRYGKMVKDLNYVNYRLLTYYYDSTLYEVRLERGHVTRIEHIL